MEKSFLLALFMASFGVLSDAKVDIPFGEENYSPSSESQIQCILNNEPFDGWYKDGTKIKNYPSRNDIPAGELGTFCVDGGGAGEKYCFLIIPANAQSTVGGNYECKGQTNKDSVRIVVKFSLTNLKQTQQIHFGVKDQIVVGAMSFPLTKFTWKKDGQPLDFDGGRITLEKDGSLTFSVVKRTDGGIYDVDMNWENRNTAQKKINVAVVEKPVFISSPKPAKVIAIKGYDYQFCFNVTGIPEPKLQFFKSTVQFDTTNSRYSINDNCMNIAKLEQMDVAKYRCTAKNTAGEVSTVVEIERIGAKPLLDDFLETSFKANINSKFEVKCSGKGDPTPTVEWSRDGKLISSKPNENTLTINDVKDANSGNYTCTIRNGLFYNGQELTDTKTISLLAVTIPSVNDRQSDKLLYSYLGNPNKVPIRCSFYGVPTPTVTISKNGTQLASGTESAQYDVATNKLSDFGGYLCTGKNTHGQGTHTVQLKQAVVPGKPTELTADKTCRSITVKWKPPKDNGHSPILQYVIGYEGGQHNRPEREREYLVPVTFKPSTDNVIKIRARNIVGVGLPAKITVRTAEFCKPSQPTIYNLAMEMYSTTIIVKWNAPTDVGFDPFISYKVYWRERKEPPEEWKVSADIDRFVRNFTIPGKLSNGKKYEFKVTATNRGGESDPSVRIVKVTIPEDPPVSDKKTRGLGKGIIAGIVVAILLVVLITIDLLCCFFNSCGVIFCCQRACCQKTYEVDGKGKSSEMEKLNKNPKPENV